MEKNTEGKVAFLKKNKLADGVEFVLGDGQKLVVRLQDFDAETLREFTLHGISQKIGDSCANLAKGREYRLAFEAMQETYDGCLEGAWNKGRQSNYADLIAAMAGLKGLPAADVATVVLAATEEKRKEWLSNKAVKAAIAELVAARKKAQAEDADELDFELPETE